MITPEQVEDALTLWRVHLSRARRTHTPEAHAALLRAEAKAYEAYQRAALAFEAQEAARIKADLAGLSPVEFEGRIINRGNLPGDILRVLVHSRVATRRRKAPE